MKKYVITYMGSRELLDLEDEGMTNLLMLDDFVCKLINENVCVEFPVDKWGDAKTHKTHGPELPTIDVDNMSQTYPHSNTHIHTNTQPVEELRKMYDELGEQLRNCAATANSQTPAPNPQGEAMPQPLPHRVSDTMVPLRDLPYLQRSEFKVHGGQIGDQTSEMSYSSIIKQLDDGIREGFVEAEVVRGALRIIKPGTFKDMLVNKDEITLPELKGFLRSHLGEKATTEMFQELMCARQSEQESPKQFLYRMIGLKQKLIFQSKQNNAEISYEPKTIQEVFLHTIYQGLGPKHTELRQRLRPLISNSRVTDEEILGQVMRILSDENEHQRRLGQLPRQKPTHAHNAKVETGNWQGNDRPRDTAAESNNPPTIQQLSAQVEALTHMVATLIDQQATSIRAAHSPTPPSRTSPHPLSHRPPNLPPDRRPQSLLSRPPFQTRGTTARCQKCIEQDLPDCNHCFVCGESGHRAVGCLKRTTIQGNGIRSLPRDSQRPMHNPSPCL